MTFIPQPYEHFVDSMLTSLTGGETREEHRFIESEESYSLAVPGAVAASIKVVGERNGFFQLFQNNIDYRYVEDTESITWKPTGRWQPSGAKPDEMSYFYVNYYTENKSSMLTDRNPGSVTTLLSEAFARELSVLHQQMKMIYESAFIKTATGNSLDLVAGLLDISRKTAKFATGNVIFKRSTPAPADISIPYGTLVSTLDGKNFETTEKRTLRKGQLSVVVPIRSQVEGGPGRVDRGLIQNLNRPIYGIEAVINDEATFFANEKETDEQLRLRIKSSLERAGKSTLDAIKFGLISDVPELDEGNVEVTERGGVAGYVDVKLGLESSGDPNLVKRIEESIQKYRAAGIRVSHSLPTRTKSGTGGDASTGTEPSVVKDKSTELSTRHVSDKAVQLSEVFSGESDGGIVLLNASAFIRLADSNLSPSQKQRTLDDTRTRIKEYIEGLPMGAELIYNKLLASVVRPDEIFDAELSVGLPSSQYSKRNLSTSGLKAKSGDITVELMEEAVLIDVSLRLQLKAERETPSEEGGGNGTPGIKTSEVTSELIAVVDDVVKKVLAECENNLLKSKLKEAIKNYVLESRPYLTFTDEDALTLSAEYEDTGRRLNNTEKVIFEEYHVSVLNPVKIEIVDKVLNG